MTIIKEAIIEKAIIMEDMLLIYAFIEAQQEEIFDNKREIISDEFLFVKSE